MAREEPPNKASNAPRQSASFHRHSRRRYFSAFTLLLSFLLAGDSDLHKNSGNIVSASNWAQTSGVTLQNNAQTEKTPWAARWGLFSGVLQMQRPAACAGELTPAMALLSEEEAKAAAEEGSAAETADDQLILVMGGDNYDRKQGGGYLLNDVWSTPGTLWNALTSDVETNKWGDPLPKIQADMKWKRVKGTTSVPDGVEYEEWIACAASRVTYAGVICNENQYQEIGGVPKWHPDMKCQCPSSAYDKYPDRTWGPRRNAAALGFGRLMFVFGGRSRSMSDLPAAEAIGSIEDDIRPKGFVREKSTLMNDVWSSPNGQEWTLVTPGCRADHMQELYTELIDPNTGQYEYPHVKILKEYNLNQGVGGLEYPTRSGSRLPGSFKYPEECTRDTDCRPLGNSDHAKTHGIEVFCQKMCSDHLQKCRTEMQPDFIGNYIEKYTCGGFGPKPGNPPSSPERVPTPSAQGTTCMPTGKCVEKVAHVRARCARNADCAGSSKCVNGGCVCNMWQPREKHAVAVFPDLPLKPRDDCAENYPGGFDSRIYIFGGFTERYTQKCAHRSCGGRYREYTNDVWRSKKDCSPEQYDKDPNGCVNPRITGRGGGSLLGQEWELVSVDPVYGGHKAPLWSVRGSHKVLVHQGMMWLLGGRGGNMRKIDDNTLHNDVWKSENGRDWELVMEHAEWSPRDEFAAGVLHKTEEWGPQRSVMIIFGGNDQIDGLGALGDTWISENGTKWIDDYSNETDHFMYIAPESPLSKLGTLTKGQIKLLNDEGIMTIQEFAEMDSSIVFKMKTGDYEIDASLGPDGWRGGPFFHVCPHKKRAEQILRQCLVKPVRIDGEEERAYCLPSSTLYPADDTTPWRASVVGERCCAAESQLCSEVSDPLVSVYDQDGLLPTEDIQLNSAGGEDGCEHPRWIAEEQELRKPESIRDEANDKILRWQIGRLKCIPQDFEIESENYVYTDVEVCSPHPVMHTCRVSPPARRSMAGLTAQGRFYVFGGMSSDVDFLNDMWYRDERVPIAQFEGPIDPRVDEKCEAAACAEDQEYRATPKSDTIDQMFSFVGDETGLMYEYHLWNVLDIDGEGIEPLMNKVLRRRFDWVYNQSWLKEEQVIVKRNWTKASGGKRQPLQIESWIGEVGSETQPFAYFQGEIIPGEHYWAGGLHVMAVRSIDPAGNTDVFWSPKNVHVWIYYAPLPGTLIVSLSTGFVGLCIATYMEYRRRKRKRAMERYAIKRMRRKFKGMQRGGPAGAGAPMKKDGNLNYKALYAGAKK